MKNTVFCSLFRYSLLAAVLLLSSTIDVKAQPQARPPARSDKVERVAYVDHGRLRRECAGMKAAKAQSQAAWQASERGYEQKLGTLQAKDESGRRALEANQQEQRRQLHKKRVEALQVQERRIVEAVGEVASEGGFTDVRPMERGGGPAAGAHDITGLVLRKLN